jgi:hypothetical protein
MLGEDYQMDDEAEECQAKALIDAHTKLACNYSLIVKLAADQDDLPAVFLI